MNIICFHNPEEENGYLSNWYFSNFIVNGIEFSSMEQYMMYKKAMCFHDENIAEQIMAIDDVAAIKKSITRHAEWNFSRMCSAGLYMGNWIINERCQKV